MSRYTNIFPCRFMITGWCRGVLAVTMSSRSSLASIFCVWAYTVEFIGSFFVRTGESPWLYFFSVKRWAAVNRCCNKLYSSNPFCLLILWIDRAEFLCCFTHSSTVVSCWSVIVVKWGACRSSKGCPALLKGRGRDSIEPAGTSRTMRAINKENSCCIDKINVYKQSLKNRSYQLDQPEWWPAVTPCLLTLYSFILWFVE